MPWQALSVLSLESHQDSAEQKHVPPSWGSIVGTLCDRFDPRIAFDLSVPSIGYARFVGGIVLQDSNGGGIEDAEDLPARLQVDGMAPEGWCCEKLRRKQGQI
jgi:hypothetical protein